MRRQSYEIGDLHIAMEQKRAMSHNVLKEYKVVTATPRGGTKRHLAEVAYSTLCGLPNYGKLEGEPNCPNCLNKAVSPIKHKYSRI